MLQHTWADLSTILYIYVDFWPVRAVLLVGKGSAQCSPFNSSPTGEELNWGRDVQFVVPSLVQMLSFGSNALDPAASKVQQVFRVTLNRNM